MTQRESNDIQLDVSVVVPVHEEAKILRSSAVELLESLGGLTLAYELILAENGSRDRTHAMALELAAAYPQIRVLHLDRADYGGALRAGILAARGRFVICEEIDICDGVFHAKALARLMRGDADMVIGSKSRPGAVDRRPWLRRFATRAYNRLLRVSLGFSGTDTHGLKAFTRATVTPVVEQCIVGFDVFASELVIRSERAGLGVVEIPVDIAEKRPPSIALWSRVPRVLRNLGRLFLAIRCGLRLGGPSLGEAVESEPSATRSLH